MGDMADNFSPGGMNAPEPEEKSIKNLIEYNSKIVGVTFEGRQEVIAMLSGDEPLRVRREPENKYDPRAVAVDVEIAETWKPIGYIAKDKNKDIAAAMDAGNDVDISIASLTGGDTDNNGKVKTRGVNIALSYNKPVELEPKNDSKSKDGYKVNSESEIKNDVKLNCSNDSNVLAQIKSLLGVEDRVELYTSRLLGRSTYVTVVDGHMRIEGYLSGSRFPDKFYPEFDEDEVLGRIIGKHYPDADEEKYAKIRKALLGMWGINRNASTGYGTAIHAALENYDKYHKLGDRIKSVKKFKTKPDEVGPNKALSRNPFLRKVVEDFHEKFGGDYVRLNEQFIWTHEERLAGSIDRVRVVDAERKIIRIQDFKTDGNIHEAKYQISESPFRGVGKKALKEGKKEKPNTVEDTLLGLHWLQLSFYAYILTKYYGYTVEGLDVYWLNPNKLIKGENAWEEFSHEVIDIEGAL